MKRSLLGLFATAAPLVQLPGIAATWAAAEAAAKPNILVIMGDDIGWMNLSCHGA